MTTSNRTALPIVPPSLIPGGLHLDSRGTLGFVNDFDFRGVDRVYWITGQPKNAFRGWVGHRRDQKWFLVMRGSVQMLLVEPDEWTAPSKTLPVRKVELAAATPQVLHVPPGFCTASVDTCGDSLLVVFSSGKIHDAKSDEFRFTPDYWRV